MTPLIGVHGFCYDPQDDPPTSLYAQWAEILRRPVVPFLYDTKHSLIGSWLKGYEGTYHRAWDEARRYASQRLLEVAWKLHDEFGQVDVACHSLGSRPVLEAAKDVPFGRALVMNGADSVGHAHACLKESPSTKWFNIRSKADIILEEFGTKYVLAAWDVDTTPAKQRALARKERKAIQAGAQGWPALVGRQGIPDAPPNWHESVIVSGHWSYRDERYWKLFRELMA